MRKEHLSSWSLGKPWGEKLKMSVGSSSKWLALFQRGAADVSHHSWVCLVATPSVVFLHGLLLTLFAAGIFSYL